MMRRCRTGPDEPAYAPPNTRTPSVVPSESGARALASPVNRPNPSKSYRCADTTPGPGFRYTAPARAATLAPNTTRPERTVVDTQGPASIVPASSHSLPSKYPRSVVAIENAAPARPSIAQAAMLVSVRGSGRDTGLRNRS